MDQFCGCTLRCSFEFLSRTKSQVQIPRHHRYTWNTARADTRKSSTASARARRIIGISQKLDSLDSMRLRTASEALQVSIAKTKSTLNRVQFYPPMHISRISQWWSKRSTHLLHLLQCLVSYPTVRLQIVHIVSPSIDTFKKGSDFLITIQPMMNARSAILSSRKVRGSHRTWHTVTPIATKIEDDSTNFIFSNLMSVLVQTSLGDFTIDLYVEKAPTAAKNFVKLALLKHYHNSLFNFVEKDRLAKLSPEKPTTLQFELTKDQGLRFFDDQIDLDHKFNKMGLVATGNKGPNLNDSAFFITLSREPITSLMGKHTIFGEVVQGLEVLQEINKAYVDEKKRPYVNIRINRMEVLIDQFVNPPQFRPRASPPRVPDPKRLEYQELRKHLKSGDQKEAVKRARRQQGKVKGLMLEMLQDVPDAQAQVSKNVLFICRLNPCTLQRDIQLIFSRFGLIRNVEIMRDWKTGQSLQYGFIQFQTEDACQQAYFSMQNAIIDDRRIHVDFSQSSGKTWKKGPERKARRVQQKKEEVVAKFKPQMQTYGKYQLILPGAKRQRSRQRK